MKTPWPQICLVWFVGVLAAAQLGKFAALMPVMRTELGLSLVAGGWLISLIEVGGATLGVAAGLVIGRMGNRRALLSGLALLGLAGLAQFFASIPAALFPARLVESGGYLLIVIAAPSLIAGFAGAGARGPALALWSTFLPLGLGAGALVSGAGGVVISWHLVCLLWGLAAAALLVVALRLPHEAGDGARRFVVPPAPVWLLALGFGAYTAIEVGVLGLLPAYLGAAWRIAPGAAGAITGVASVATILGSFAASRVLARQSPHTSRAGLGLIAIGLFAPALLLFVAFPLPGLAHLAGATCVAVLAVAVNAFSGLVPAVVFARLADLAETRRNGPAAVAAANGVLAQFGAGGSLIGPPALGFLATHLGWGAVGPTALFAALFSLALAMAAERQGRPAAQSTLRT